MKEIISISMPKEAPAFLKATDPVCGLVKGANDTDRWMVKETRYWNFKWWLMEEDDDPVRESMTRSLNKAQKIYEEYFAQEGNDVGSQEPASKPENHGFGRGFAFGRGQHVPSRWLLLGGSRSMVGCGKTTRRKAGPTSKGSCGGKLTFQ